MAGVRGLWLSVREGVKLASPHLNWEDIPPTLAFIAMVPQPPWAVAAARRQRKSSSSSRIVDAWGTTGGVDLKRFSMCRA